MLRSMYSGVSGLRGYQTMIDVVGNNIANVNTIGFKAGQTVFQDLLSQTLQGAGLPAEGGGTNPAQIGLGMRLAGTTTSFGQGGLQNTGRSTDMSIQGDGFFVVRRDTNQFFTRAGSFTLDGNGRLATPQGTLVQGWTADALGNINTNLDVADILMPVGSLIDPQATTEVVVGGNLPASAPVSTPANPTLVSSAITVYDANGAAKSLTFEYEKTAANRWELKIKANGAYLQNGGAPPVDAVWEFSFNAVNGTVAGIDATGAGTAGGATTTGSLVLTNAALASFGDFDPATTITVRFDQGEPLSQFSGINSLAARDQNGSAPGALQTFTISQEGVITGVFSNGRTQNIAQIAIANFANPAGLEKLEGSMYRPTANSGLAQIGVAGIAGRGTLAGGTLEMSNVDLAQEFTNLIVAQRGFQASTRIITASDEVLNDLVNIRR